MHLTVASSPILFLTIFYFRKLQLSRLSSCRPFCPFKKQVAVAAALVATSPIGKPICSPGHKCNPDDLVFFSWALTQLWTVFWWNRFFCYETFKEKKRIARKLKILPFAISVLSWELWNRQASTLAVGWDKSSNSPLIWLKTPFKSFTQRIRPRLKIDPNSFSLKSESSIFLGSSCNPWQERGVIPKPGFHAMIIFVF